MSNIIDGLMISNKIKDELKEKIEKLNIKSSLTVVQVGDNSASNLYIKNKKKACLYVGLDFNLIKFDDDVTEEEIIDKINELNRDLSVNGIIVQLPLPSNLNANRIISYISPLKDVDGLTSQNVGNLSLGNEALVSCTPLGVMELLKEYKVNLSGKNVCIVGRSNLVGKPLIQLLLNEDATVSVCHSKSYDIKRYTSFSDVLIVAAGHAKLITKDMVKDGAVVIDVGINKENNVLSGDVDFDEVSKKASLITPVPGGVGPMTVACLLKNVVKAYEMQH